MKAASWNLQCGSYSTALRCYRSWRNSPWSKVCDENRPICNKDPDYSVGMHYNFRLDNSPRIESTILDVLAEISTYFAVLVVFFASNLGMLLPHRVLSTPTTSPLTTINSCTLFHSSYDDNYLLYHPQIFQLAPWILHPEDRKTVALKCFGQRWGINAPLSEFQVYSLVSQRIRVQ